jgi:hypothetical protein
MNSALPFDIGMSIAADAGKTTKNNYGVQFMMSRNFYILLFLENLFTSR